LDVPPEVVTVTGTAEDGPTDAGTVTVHEVCTGQLVGAGWDPNWKRIWPSELMKLVPVTTTVCPALPVAGLSRESVGAPPVPGATDVGGVVEAGVAGAVAEGAGGVDEAGTTTGVVEVLADGCDGLVFRVLAE
jgi:hypothetical protein